MVAERVSFLPTDAAPDASGDWPEQPITRLALKPRATSALQQSGLHTVAAVVARWRENRQGLLDIPDFGERSLQDLERKLRDLGLIY
ncbi:MAG TPA: DNA-directed RNA polymerase subunit alpha C-terminal domain-containing protein [Anaerolineae bacterium]|nr:DNA-directed RNA polymerase subunit alpha C-terminal domain-containing protein [Anaerolineae bacterium]